MPRYPSVVRRYIASVVDMSTVIFLIYLIVQVTGNLGSVGNACLFVGVLSCYEPIATVYYATLGQLLMRFRVRRASDLSQLDLSMAWTRAFFKYPLGFISFLSIPVHKEKKALHDLIAGTIVIESSVAQSVRS
jgi:uncharacterized RDD family membrane protein YckC